jgi:membrane protein implicated in regulation of membrane protease activity
MPDRVSNSPAKVPDRKPEPPLIARARRIGWGLILIAALAALLAKSVAPDWRLLFGGIALGCALLGFLAIINVALVRGLYRTLDEAPQPDMQPGPQNEAGERDAALENIAHID